MAKQSLAAAKGIVEPAARSGGLILPQAAPIAVVRGGFDTTPYIVFATSKSAKLWPVMSAAIQGLETDETVLLRPEPKRPVRLSPLRFHLLAAFQYWAQFDQADFRPNAARLEPPEEGTMREWAEQIESVVLAYHGEKLVPASIRWGKTKCGGAHKAIAALRNCSKVSEGGIEGAFEEWGALSADHKLTQGVPVNWARFVAQCKVLGGKTSKTSGFRYAPSTSLIFPATAGELKIVSDSFADAEFVKSLDAVKARYEREVETIRALSK